MIGYSFFIDNTEVDEPIGWDGVEFELKRSTQYEGSEFVFTNEVTFLGDAAQYLREAFAIDGVDAEVAFQIRRGNDVLYLGRFDFTAYKSMEGPKVSIRIETDDFLQKVFAAGDTPVDLSVNEDFFGKPIPAIDFNTYRLHSQRLVKRARWNRPQTDSITQDITDISFKTGIAYSHPMITLEIQELQQANNLIPFVYYQVGASLTDLNPTSQITFLEDGTADIKLKLDGSFELGIVNGASRVQGQFVLAVAWGDTPTSNFTTLFTQIFVADATSPQIISFSESFELFNANFTAGQSFWLHQYVVNFRRQSAVHFADIRTRFTVINTSFLDVKAGTIVAPSTAKGLLVHDVLARILHRITGKENPLYSPFLGNPRTKYGSYPNRTDTITGDGPASNIIGVNGFAIRNMKTEQGNEYPMVFTFNQVFKSLANMFNLGIASRGGQLYIAPKDDFFTNDFDTTLTLANASDISLSPFTERIYNAWTIGYNSWEAEDVQGIEAPNAKITYALPVAQLESKADRISQAITEGNLIEQARRLQFRTEPTTDYKHDNELFFISLNEGELAFSSANNPYETGVAATYAKGTVSFRGTQTAGTALGISYPENRYNLQLSCANLSAYHTREIASASFYRFGSQGARPEFIEGALNFQLTASPDGGLSLVPNYPRAANTVLRYNTLRPNFGKPFYIPEKLEFSYPLTYEQFMQLTQETERMLRVTCGQIEYFGYISTVKFRPNIMGGIADFTLIRAYV